MKDKHTWLFEPAFPVVYAQHYLAVAKERGLDTEPILREAGLNAQQIADPAMRLSPFAYRNLAAAVLRAGGDNGLGFDVGWRTPPTAHGSLGYALLCSANLTEASQMLERFRHLRGRGTYFVFTQHPDFVQVEFKEEADFGDPFLRKVMLQALVSSFYRAIQILLGDGSKPGEIWLDQEQPEYFSRFQDQLPRVRFSMPGNQIRLPNDTVKRPLPLANPAALQLALQQCEREEALLGKGENTLLKQVRAALVLSPHGHPTAEQLADLLHISPRTFRRKLFDHGNNYKQLLEDARRRDAMMLLEQEGLEIQHVAKLLGYENPANFTRAFREWSGRSPSQYRSLRNTHQDDDLSNSA